MKDFLKVIEDFCGDNYIWALTGAAAVLILIVAVAAGMAVKALRRGKLRGEETSGRDYFLEGEYDEMLKRRASENNRENSSGGGQEMHKNSEITEESVAETESLAEIQNEAEDSYKPEDELESLSEQPVCINISIERGQVKIGYSADGQVSCSVGTEPEDHGAADETDVDKVKNEMQSSDSGHEIIMEKINLVKGAATRKFGPDNLNTGKSGRIYTEEELHRRIRE